MFFFWKNMSFNGMMDETQCEKYGTVYAQGAYKISLQL